MVDKLTPFKTIRNKIAFIKLNKQTSISLLAVSKRRPVEGIMKLYKEGQRNFGENYVPELEEKASNELLPKDINWHMIGHLQSNKAKKLLKIKNLTAIESVDTYKLAEEIDKQCGKLNRTIEIYIQVNISNELSKSGCDIDKVVEVYKEIYTNMKNIKLVGIMSLGTIGSVKEFDRMYDLKKEIAEELKIDINNVNMSFGTSADYEEAIIAGSTQVRVGSVLFI